MTLHRRSFLYAGLAGCIATAGCIGGPAPPPKAGTGGGGKTGAIGAASELKGMINIEGSSTVFPITQAMSREFETLHPEVQIPVAGNGTTTGFNKFLLRETEICDASRPITEGEIEKCKEAKIDFLELQVAIDGLSVVVNKDNDWVDTISVADLRKIWDQDSDVKKWSDVNPAWPDEPLELFGAGTDSGTFDYFTEVINGKAKRSRSDYSASENDNILVSGVTNNKYSMGYFGFAYYVTAADKLKALKIIPEGGEEGVAPTPETVESGAYTPLSRPLFIYVNKESLQRPEVAEFVTYYLSDVGQDIVEKRKYVRMNAETLAEMRQRLADAIAGK
jgi:phosphate transport system substrate-binding protein